MRTICPGQENEYRFGQLSSGGAAQFLNRTERVMFALRATDDSHVFICGREIAQNLQKE